MNHIFKKIWNKSLGRMIVVSENAKSAGKTDNTTGIQQNSLSNAHYDEQGKSGVFSFKPFVLQSLALSVAMILGGNTQADDNYARTTTDTAVGSAKGLAHTTTATAGKITAVGGITVTTTGAGTSLDDIDSFTANGVTTTKAANPTAVAAFINAAKKGGNIAVGSYSSAVGTANIASGSASSAVGFNNNASRHYSSAVGYVNTASGQSSSAVGYVNTASGSASSAVGTLNFAKGQYSTAMGMENYTQNQSSAAVGTRKIPNQALTPFVTGGVITSVNGINVTATGSSLNDITHINGTAVNATELNAFLEHLVWGGNLALADESSVFGVGGITTGNRSTAIGFDSLADEANTVSVGRAGAEKRITNVATPTKATDAANKGYVDTKFASVTGGTVATDNYASSTTETALGSAKGTPHATTTTAGKITAVGGITVTTTGAGTSLDDIDSFTANGVAITKAADPAKVAAFINAAKKGGNIAVGQLSSAVGTANIASGNNSSALGSNNTASSNNSSALGYGNTASNLYSNALGYRNTASNLYSNALGFNNDALGWSSSSVGLGNLTTQFASSAFGFFNAAVAESSTAMGSGISGGVSSRLRTLEEKVENGKLVSVNGVAVTATGNTTATITHVNGVAVDENQKSQFLNILRQGNVAAGQYSSAMGVRNLATGVDSSAFGYGNDASGVNSSAVGFENTASNGDLNNAFGAYNKNNGAAKNTAVGIGNIINSSAWGTNALGYSNNVSNLYGSAIGTKNTVTVVGGNAIGLNNIVTGGYANAIGTGNTVIGQNGAAVGSGLADYAGNLGPQVVLTPFSYTPTFSSVGGVTTLDGVVIKTSAADWAALSANPGLLTEVNGQSVTAAQATDIINNFKQGGNLALSNRSSVFGINSKAVAAGATAIGLNSVADEANTISVGRAGATKRITNVATGTDDTDAINKKQLTDALAAIPNATPSDNYARASSSTALGSAKGSPHTITTISGKIATVGGIAVTTTGAGTTLDDIDSFTVNSLTTTKAADPVKFATFINAIKKGGNLAMDGQASALGTGNIASGLYSNAVGNSNTASSGYSTAVGYSNTASSGSSTALGNSNSASGTYNTAVGYSNTTSNGDLNNALGAYNKNNGGTKNTAVGIGNIIDSTGWGTNALGYSNSVGNSFGSAIGTKNTVTVVGGNAIGLNNIVTGGYANAIGTGNTVIGQNAAAFGSGLAAYTGILGQQVVLTPVSYTPTFSSVGGVTTLDGVVIKTSAADWAALSANPSLLTEVNGQSLTAAQATDIINNFKQGGNLALSNRSSVFGINSKAVAAGATAIGLNSVADEANTISVGRAGAEKRITNVATPVNATDAANKGYVDTKFASVTGGTVATDNYASSTTETALGSARGTAHTTTLTSGKITAVGGIVVSTNPATAGTSLDDIDSFTANGVTTTKTDNPTAVAAFINAAKKGGNIAVGSYSSAVGTANIASGLYSSAVGYSNTVVSNFGNGNNAFGSYNKNHGQFFSTAMGVGNLVHAGSWGTNAIGYSNTVSGLGGSALGTANTVKTTGSNAVGFNNLVSGGYYANAFGTGNTAMGLNTTAVGSGLASYGSFYSPDRLLLTPNYTLTMTTVGGVTTLDGVVIETTAADWSTLKGDPSLLTKVNGQAVTAAQATDIVKSFGQGGNLALADHSSVFGINSKAVATGATAIGLNSVADEANTISVGRAGATKRITNVATPVNATDATNKAYVDTALSNFTANADTVLYDTASNQATLTLAGANGTKITNLQDATLDATSKDAVTGKQLNATNTALTDGLALKADQTALTTGLANTLTDAKGYTDVEVGKLDTKLGTEVGTLNTRISNEVGTLNTTISGIDGRVTTNTNDIALLKTNTGNLAANAVIYDSATKDTITLAGTNGTKLTGLQDATLDATSKDAVTGKQLHATNTSITALDGRVTTEVGTLNTAITNSANTINTRIDGVDTRIGNEVTALDGKITTNKNAISTLDGRVTTEVGNLNTAITNSANTINTRIDGVDTRIGNEVTALDGKITTNKNAISTLDGRVTTEVGNLNTAITTSANTINTRIDGVDTRIGQEVTALDGKITTNKNAISTLDGRVTTEVGNLNTAITTSANTINTRIDGVDTRIGNEVTTLNTRIGTEVGTLNTRINNEVGTLNTTISGLDGRVTTNTNDIALLKTNTGNLAANAVIYDSATKDTITLAGTNGTKLTGLQDATLDATSKDAVTGKQLHATNTSITALDGRVTTEVGNLNTAITNSANTINTRIDGVDTRIGNEVTTLNTKIGTEVGTLNTRINNEVGTLNSTISGIDGRVTTNSNDIAALQNGLGGISANAVMYDSATKDMVTLKGTNGTKLTGLQDATLDATSKDAVTGKQLHATNTSVTTLSDRVTTEVDTLNTAITTSANTINTRIDGVDTRIGNEVTTLNTRVDTTNTALVQALGGGAAWNNGVFTNPAFSIQGKAKNTVSDAFIAVDQQLGAIKTSVSDLKTHTDQQAVSNLNDAKNYADQQTTTALNNAKGYTDQKTTSTLNDAKSYTDQKAADGKAYTDQQTASTLNNAKNYADQKAADGKAYTDQQTASALNDAKSYADQKAASSLSGAKDYTDQQTASVLSTANGYTDSKIADVQTQLTASNQFVQVNGVTDAQAASATGENSVAIGTNTVVTGHRSTAVGVGNQVSGNGSGAFGDPNTVSGNGSYVVGNDNKVTGDNTFVLGNNVDTQAKNAVVLGNDSASDRDNTVSVGAKGKERQIIHVADAVEDTDAVNYQQLKAAEKSTNNYTNERVNALNSAFNDYRMETEQRFHKVDERFNRQGAMTAAMMNMSSSAASVKGQNRVGVGAGFQGQEQAVSIGYQRIINDNTSLTIGGAFTKEESSGGVGVGFGW